MSQQSSPTPDPVAWMVRSGAGHSIGQPELVEALARGNAERYNRLAGWRDKPYTVVPLYDHPSALPATTPSDDRAVDRFVARVLADPFCASVTEHALVLEVKALREEIDRLRGISPSEGSAPDTPTDRDVPEPDDSFVPCAGCGARLEPGEAKVFTCCEACWDRHYGRTSMQPVLVPRHIVVEFSRLSCQIAGAQDGDPLDWARLIAAIDRLRVPPSAPDTKPDERLFRTPEDVKDAWGEVEELAINAGVDGRAWIEAVGHFWRVANLASEPVASMLEIDKPQTLAGREHDT